MSVTPEGAVKKAVKKALAAYRLWYYMPVQNGLGRVGIPDFVGCLPYVVRQEDVGKTVGLFFAIETKAPGKVGQTTPNQDREIAGIRAAGGWMTVLDDARELCLPVSNDGNQIDATQAGVSEAVQRPAGDGEAPGSEQCREARNDSRGSCTRRRRAGRRASHSARPARHEQPQQPGDANT